MKSGIFFVYLQRDFKFYKMKIIDKFFKISAHPKNQDLVKVSYDWKKIKKIPEMAKLAECKQNPKWHSEGDALKHTMAVCEHALKYINETYNDNFIDSYPKAKKGETNYFMTVRLEKVLIFLAGALFHDIGKGVTTFEKNGVWHSYGHEVEGEKIVRRLLWDEDLEIRESICKLVRWHMEPLHILDHRNSFSAFAKLARVMSQDFCEFGTLDEVSYVNMGDLLHLKMCDILGSKHKDEDGKLNDINTINRLIRFYENCFYDDCFYDNSIFCKMSDEPNIAFGRKGDAKMSVLVGLPGAGKDTFIKSMFESGDWDNENSVVLCRDDLRAELGYCKPGEKVVLSSRQENDVTEVFNTRLLDAAKKGKHIIINNTNLKRKYRDTYTRYISNYTPYVEYYYIEATGIDTNKARRDGQISEEVFESMIKNFEFPSPFEYNMLHICKNSN